MYYNGELARYLIIYVMHDAYNGIYFAGLAYVWHISGGQDAFIGLYERIFSNDHLRSSIDTL